MKKVKGFKGFRSSTSTEGDGVDTKEAEKKTYYFGYLGSISFHKPARRVLTSFAGSPAFQLTSCQFFIGFFGYSAGGAFHLGSAFIAPTQSGEMSAKAYAIICGLSKEPLETQRLVSLPYVVDWDSL